MGKKYKKILKFMLSLTMLLTCIFQLPIQVNALTRTNYALNKPVTESYAYPGMESDKAVDGDTTASVKTGDDASLIMLMSLAGLSALGLVYSKKKRKNI